MIKDFVDNIYLINRDDRQDRLEKMKVIKNRFKLPYERVSAIEGESLPELDNANQFWNSNAYALILTTINIVNDAKIRGYKKILILEDDVIFTNNANKTFDNNIKCITGRDPGWQMIYLGGLHTKKPEQIICNNGLGTILNTGNVARVRAMYCLHAYIISERIYDYYMHVLKNAKMQMDILTMRYIQTLGKSYCFYPSIARQRRCYSNIQKRNVAKK